MDWFIKNACVNTFEQQSLFAILVIYFFMLQILTVAPFMYVCIYLFYELISNCVVCRASSCSAYLLVLIRFVCFCFYKCMIREADGSLNHYEFYA